MGMWLGGWRGSEAGGWVSGWERPGWGMGDGGRLD